MASSIVYQGDVQRTDLNMSNSLFSGLTMYFSHSIPQRKWFVDQAQANGALITLLDTQADIILFDHARKNAPTGAVSYQFVEFSLRNKILENVEQHRISSTIRAERPVGSMITASKGSRNKFTDAEDQLLWNWIKPFADAGGLWKGNEIYKQLERHNPRHTFQSWRDRWIKHTQFQNRKITAQIDPEIQGEIVELVAPPQFLGGAVELAGQEDHAKAQSQAPLEISPEKSSRLHTETLTNMGQEQSTPDLPRQPSPLEEPPASHALTHRASEVNEPDDLPLDGGFDIGDAHKLYNAVPWILIADSDYVEKCWSDMAREYGRHSKESWQLYFDETILPVYRRRKGLDTDDKLVQHLEEFKLAEDANQNEANSTRESAQTTADPLSVTDLQQSGSDQHGNITAILQLSPMKTASQGNQSQSAQSNPRSQISLTLSQSSTYANLLGIPYRADAANDAQKGDFNDVAPSQASISAQPIQRHAPSNTSRLKRRYESIDHTATSPKKRQVLSRSEASEPSSKEQPKDEPGSVAQLMGSEILQDDDNTFADVLSGHAVTLRPASKASPKTRVQRMDLSSANESDDELESLLESLLENLLEQEIGSGSERQDSRGSSGAVNSAEEALENMSSQQSLHLFEDDKESTPLRVASSPYALSEAASEIELWDQRPELSRPWDTAPEANEIPPASSTTQDEREIYDADDQQLPDNAETQSYEDKSLKSNTTAFETAPEILDNSRTNSNNRRSALLQPSNSSSASGESGLRNRAVSSTKPGVPKRVALQEAKDRLNTQDLFQQSFGAYVLDPSFTVPPPEGGWDDDDEEELAAEAAEPFENTSPGQLAKQAGNVIAGSPVTASETMTETKDEVDIWIDAQQSIHKHINPFVVEQICLDSLSATCLQLDIASDLAPAIMRKLQTRESSLASKFEIFSSSTDRRRHGIHSSRPRPTKAQIRNAFEDMLPRNVRGIWTPEDDANLVGTNARGVEEVQRKHGEENMELRFAYLEQFHDDTR